VVNASVAAGMTLRVEGTVTASHAVELAGIATTAANRARISFFIR
jgi:hypothetical protein